MADRVGQQVGNYHLLRLLGKGGFAEVYLGEHIHLGTQAAVKLLNAPLATTADVEKFRQEARTIATLTHPHIVRVLEFGLDGELPYLVMEYAPGGALRQHYPEGASVPLPTVAALVRQIADGLQYAHDHQVIHRDIKPQNLLLGQHDEVLLSDFGISVVAESTTRQHTMGFAGTVAYASPEQLQGKPQRASDQYSLGVLVYEWLTGQLPFRGSFIEVFGQHLQTPPPPLREKMPTLPPAVEQVVLTALGKDLKERFGSLHAFAHAFETAAQAAGDWQNAPTRRTSPNVPSIGQPPANATPHGGWLPSGGPLLPPVGCRPMHSRLLVGYRRPPTTHRQGISPRPGVPGRAPSKPADRLSRLLFRPRPCRRRPIGVVT